MSKNTFSISGDVIHITRPEWDFIAQATIRNDYVDEIQSVNLVWGVSMPYCKYCGAAHDDDAVFCTACGKQIEKKHTPAERKLQEVVLESDAEEIVDGGFCAPPYRPGDPIPPEMEARLNAYRERVAQYSTSLTVFKRLFREQPELFGEEEWVKMEQALAEKYELPDNSIFRQKEFPNFDAENEGPASARRNATYTKRKTEYWSQFEKSDDET